jgi:tetratricopeptide (TPR) repeat protein
MTRTIKYYLLVFTFSFYHFISNGQKSKIDSLISSIKIDREDTTKITNLNTLGWELMYQNPDTSIILGNQALALCEQLKSLHYKASKISKLESVTYGNLGVYYHTKANYPMALGYYLKALKIDEGLNNKKGIASRLGNIGIVYKQQGNYPKALEYYLKALKIGEELEDKNIIATQFGNIGNVYYSKGNYTKSLDYYLSALKKNEEIGNKSHISAWLGNIGSVYSDQNDYPKALEYYLRALQLKEELGNKKEIAITLGNIGSVYTSIKKYALAEKYLLEALKLSKEIGVLNEELDVENYFTTLYEKTGKEKLALQHFKKAVELKDSLFNIDKEQDITRKSMNYEFEKKEMLSKAEQNKKDAITTAEKQQQKVITYSVSVGLFLVFLLALFIFRGYKQKQKANIIITEQKAEVERQKEITEEQKIIVEEKNKDITDSINYAKRIQDAILIPENEIKKQFSDAFVLFNPKDIVSGDFYWFAESKYNKILAIADCTGHGVPGGFMSMLGFSMLQETILLEEIKTTAEALTSLDKKITETLNRNTRSYRDGMDMALCSFSKSSNTLQFSCANRPLILIRDGEVTKFSPDKHTIGGAIDNITKDFNNYEIETKKNDVIYIFSDGYTDQFGGSKEKKFTYKQLEKTLLANHHLSMNEQKKILENMYNDWKGNLEQVDDVCVIGVRL